MQVALQQASHVTAIHLIRSNKKRKTATVARTLSDAPTGTCKHVFQYNITLKDVYYQPQNIYMASVLVLPASP